MMKRLEKNSEKSLKKKTKWNRRKESLKTRNDQKRKNNKQPNIIKNRRNDK